MTKGVSIKFTIQLDQYEPLQVGVWAERDKLPDESDEDFAVNVAREVVKDLHKISSSIAEEVKELKRKMMDDLNDD